MKHRHLPFGYKMLDGEIALHQIESEAVQHIFTLSISGLGYASITKELNEGDVPYHPDKPWNKNMVARILANPRYLGRNGCPAIIEPSIFEAVAARKAADPHCHQQRRKQPAPGGDYRLGPYQPTAMARRLTNDINRGLERSPDPDIIRSMIFACAAEKYNGIGVTCNG